MMSPFLQIFDALLILAGAMFVFLASLGLVRLPDLYTRMHSASKAGAVGAGFLLLSLAFHAESTAEALRAVAAIFFFLLTAPIAAHLLAKASYTVGYHLWPGSVLDEMSKVAPKSGESIADGRPREEFFTGKALEPAWRRDKRSAPPKWSDLRKK
ncbi:monovalent cation/H(+) antiporter subunit G [Fulvimarina sp. MAC3]|uniref:monovalent cation/H(+) antiporter subunit G n=1 Tax=Fulvimarina sp. MAC3 TaxID=3148887 RepID=UPI0031FD4397